MVMMLAIISVINEVKGIGNELFLVDQKCVWASLRSTIIPKYREDGVKKNKIRGISKKVSQTRKHA